MKVEKTELSAEKEKAVSTARALTKEVQSLKVEKTELSAEKEKAVSTAVALHQKAMSRALEHFQQI